MSNVNNPEWEKQARLNQARLKPRKLVRRLRKWQYKAIRRFFALNRHQCLITGTPDSGKSLVAGGIALESLKQGRIKRIVVVVPTEQLKMQWARVFAGLGIDLDPNWSNSTNSEADDYMGVIVTYQQVSAEPSIYDLNCENSTLVIFDEIHHAADALDWGVKLRKAFARAAYVLSLSGTPFRHDNHSIPFVRYDSAGRSIADFSYSYAEALGDGVCRPVFFPSFEGSASWYDTSGNLKTQSEFADLSKDKSAELLRALLDPEGGWMKTVLRQADEKLSEFRGAGHQDAAGLIIAIDQSHAKRIAKRIRQITGEAPSVVISEDPEATRILQEFARPGCLTRWIVAVKMVSEGIDLPRLRVGVYATNILSELFFRQAVGRFVRMIEGLGEQSAAFYLPAHPALIKHALSIKVEREHVLPHLSLSRSMAYSAPGVAGSTGITGDESAKVGLPGAEQEEGGNPSSDGGESGFDEAAGDQPPSVPSSPLDMGLAASVKADRPAFSRQVIVTLKTEALYQETIFDGFRLSDDELRRAEYHGRKCGLSDSAEKLAAFLRAAAQDDGNAASPITGGESTPAPASASPGNNVDGAGSNHPQNSPLASPETSPAVVQEAEIRTLSEQKLALRDRINKMTNILAYRNNVNPGVIHGIWTHDLKEKSNGEASLVDLERKLAWLAAKLDQQDWL